MSSSASTHPLFSLQPTSVFASRYTIEERVGQGGMGAVYRAYDRALDEVIALKVLAPIANMSAEVARLFRQEVKLSRRITHTNVVRVFDIGEEQELLYMTMEYIDGRTLRQEMKSAGGKPAVPNVLGIALALADGLSAVHGHGIVHRDLKPANVMITQTGRVLLTDFGVAVLSTDPTTGVLGTIRYMAPEQFRKGGVGKHSDIYAFGLVLLEALTGDLPFRNPMASIPRIDSTSISLASLANDSDPALLDGLQALLRHCLAEEPADRASSIDQVRVTIAGLIRDHLTVREPTIETSSGRREAWLDFVGQLGMKGITVLSFRHVGPTNLSHLGNTLADDLVDSLASCRGLRVLGTGVTSPFFNSRDPMTIGEKLGVVAVVDGTLQTLGDKGRLSIRLLDAKTGHQSWSEQYE